MRAAKTAHFDEPIRSLESRIDLDARHRLSDPIVSGELRPVEPVSYPFEDAARALADQQQRRVVGKAVLVP